MPDTAFHTLLRTFGLLEKVMHPHFARFGVSGSQWGVLRSLHRAEAEGAKRLRLTDLSAGLIIRPPSVTGVVDRLQRMGLVSRDTSPTDMRAKEIKLTDKGRRLVDRVLAVHGRQIQAVLAGLDSNEQQELRRLLGRLGEHLTHWLDEGGTPVTIDKATDETTAAAR